MQAREMRNLTTAELQKRLEDAYREQFNLRRAVALRRLEDYTRLRAVRREIARIKTLLRERELSAELAGLGEEAA